MIRGIGVRGAVAVNVITMIGIGPLITIPLVLQDLHGSTALYAWIAGAVIALCDGLAWAELGSLYPGSGGTYAYVRDAFGAERWGRLAAFLFVWQIVLSAPLVLASGYIGFADYAGYLWPALGTSSLWQGTVGAAVGVLTLVLLYRNIGAVGRIGVGLAGVAIATLAAVIVAGASRFEATRALAGDPHVAAGAALAAGLGPALVITLYDYYGYGAACTIGDEVRAPARTLPWSVLASIAIVAALYVALQAGVLGSVSWHELVPSSATAPLPAAANYVASTVVERAWGSWPARAITLAVLATAFASTFGNLLAYSRIPYAAARDGLFFAPFATLHDRGRFPHLALLAIGLLALPACFLPLGTVIAALTTGLVIVQSVAQLLAVALLRKRGIRAPYRMWLYPLPALVALGGWLYIFCSAGTQAIVFGIVSLAAGAGAFLWLARARTSWPFAVKAALALIALACGTALPSSATTWGHAGTVERNGWPIFEVDGKPYFVYGAAFFYERLPRDRWDASMGQLQALGVNTLDLYVPWNWHELADGDFDFDGRTNPRRDLDEVLRLARVHGFKILLRPGPVVRNEWRNGGYPAWLLSRPEYGMPLHDLLEGRYPPTATLQNAHSDDAAAQWMANATHTTYAKRWLERVLRECAPDADLILAVALDDDQGAYLDNQTYPAPHLQRYLGWLRDVVHGVTGPREPVFINTYQMKVPASSPVWAMGNWYQSDAYAIGDHDRAQLELSYGMLETRPGQPLFASEFQAGWLQGPNEIRPRAADPRNTALALSTMIGMGVRGIVLFPAQDTLDPGGWEAPFANWFYDWDAALRLSGTRSERARPVAGVGTLVRLLGPALAASHPIYDAAIAYLPAARVDAGDTASVAADAAALELAQTQCREAGMNCRVVDVAALSLAQLAQTPLLIVPPAASLTGLREDVRAKLAAFATIAGHRLARPRTAADLRLALTAVGRKPVVENVPGGTFAWDASGRTHGFLSATNYSDRQLEVRNARINLGDRVKRLPDFALEPHRGFVIALDLPLAIVRPQQPKNDVLAFSTCMPQSIESEPDGIAVDAPPSCSLDFATAAGRSHYDSQGDSDEFAGGFFERLAWVASSGAVGFAIRHADPNMALPGQAVSVGGQYLGASQSYDRPSIPPELFDPQLPLTRDSPPAAARAETIDLYRDGTQDVVLSNGLVGVAIDPDAGARSFAFGGVFTTIGGLRDDVAIEPPLSQTDRIARYTHQLPAGTFNRPYATSVLSDGPIAKARFRYTAPDVLPAGATFDRTVSLPPGRTAFAVDETVTFAPAAEALPDQRAVSVSSLAFEPISAGSTGIGAEGTTAPPQYLCAPTPAALVADAVVHVRDADAFGFFSPHLRRLATIAWRAGDVEDAEIEEQSDAVIVRLTLAPGRTTHVEYGVVAATSDADVSSALATAAAAAQVAPEAARTP